LAFPLNPEVGEVFITDGDLFPGDSRIGEFQAGAAPIRRSGGNRDVTTGGTGFMKAGGRITQHGRK